MKRPLRLSVKRVVRSGLLVIITTLWKTFHGVFLFLCVTLQPKLFLTSLNKHEQCKLSYYLITLIPLM